MIKSLSKNYIWVIGILGLILFYFFFNPMENRWMPQCFFYKVTGLQCMGCGSQRMLHALLHGDIAGAMEANLFLFCSLPFLAFLIWVEFSRTSHPVLYSKIHTKWTMITITAMLIAWLFIRNIYGL